LRTPLTALRLEAESIRNSADADRVGAAVDGLAGAVDDLISEARRPSTAPPELVEAGPVIEERVAFWSALADEQHRAVRVRIEEGLPAIPLSPVALADVVDALVGNVFAHTPEGTAFAVTLRRVGALVTLAFDDGGPGFGNGDILRRGVSLGGSTGLGLDIARRVVEAAGGTLNLDRSPMGGGRVELLVPISGRPRPDDTPRRGWLRRAKTPVGA
jgi:signal transduction histidine kinase